MTVTTYLTFPEFLYGGDRPASLVWDRSTTVAEGVALALRVVPEAVILRAVRGTETVRGLAPGGLA